MTTYPGARPRFGALAKAFESLDKDGNGRLSKAEIELAIRRVAPLTTDAEVKRMVSAAASSGSEEITLPEFATMMLFGAGSGAASGAGAASASGAGAGPATKVSKRVPAVTGPTDHWAL